MEIGGVEIGVSLNPCMYHRTCSAVQRPVLVHSQVVAAFACVPICPSASHAPYMWFLNRRNTFATSISVSLALLSRRHSVGTLLSDVPSIAQCSYDVNDDCICVLHYFVQFTHLAVGAAQICGVLWHRQPVAHR